VTEDERLVSLVPTPVQELLAQRAIDHRHNIVVKYRQAKVTTWCVMWMLGQILYNKGLKGLLIANAEKTVDEAMSRMHDAYDWLPKAVRVPFIRRNMHMLQVMHKGRVVGITSGRGKETKPAMGTSPDRYVFTEFGEWENADAAMGHIMPSFRKRPNARGWNEGTPGEHMCRQHRMWLAAMEGKGMYHPTFLRWWEDDTCVLPPDQVKRFDGWKPGNDDIAYVESVLATNKANERLGVGDATEPSLEHLKFRRDILESEFSGKEWLFTNKYPPNPHAGFVSSLTPKLPKDAIERQLTEAVRDPPYDFEARCSVLEYPEWGRQYVAFADPNSYGRAGDPSGILVFDAHTFTEVASFQAREDPARFADRCINVARFFNDALLVVESNQAACIATVVAYGYSNIWRHSDDHPGFYTTALRKKQAEGYLIKGLLEDLFTVRTMSTLHQALTWDGRWKRRRQSDDDSQHHYERLVCLFMAAWVFHHRTWAPPKEAPNPKIGLSVADIDRLVKSPRRRR